MSENGSNVITNSVASLLKPVIPSWLRWRCWFGDWIFWVGDSSEGNTNEYQICSQRPSSYLIPLTLERQLTVSLGAGYIYVLPKHFFLSLKRTCDWYPDKRKRLQHKERYQVCVHTDEGWPCEDIARRQTFKSQEERPQKKSNLLILDSQPPELWEN